MVLCVRLSVQTHISVTAGRNFIILGMMMGYDLGMMPIDSTFLYCLIRDVQSQTKMSVSAITIQQIHFVHFSPMFTHYIGLVLAAHTGQKG